MTHSSTDTIIAGITATNDNNFLALGADVRIVLELGIQ